MVSCPACGAKDVGGRSQCGCGADLELLWKMEELADLWFNLGREALTTGKPGRAVEWLAASCAAQPTDAANHRALAKAWAQMECWTQAADALERAEQLEPDSSLNDEIRQAIEKGTRDQ